MGVILCDYILSQLKLKNKLPDDAVIVKTIVTSVMVDAVAKKYGATVKDVLTGFKYIGDVLNKRQRNEFNGNVVFGFEESCGYLKGDYVRDKDGVVAAMLIAECSSLCKRQGKTLLDYMNELYAEHGNYCLKTLSYRFEGADGLEIKNKLLADLRVKPFTYLGESEVIKTCDYLTQREYDLPKSNVIQFNSINGSQLIIRPSGTEPLIKCYITVCGTNESNAERLTLIKAQLDGMFLTK